MVVGFMFFPTVGQPQLQQFRSFRAGPCQGLPPTLFFSELLLQLSHWLFSSEVYARNPQTTMRILLSVGFSCVYLSIHLSCLSIDLSLCLCVCLSIYIYLPICVSIWSYGAWYPKFVTTTWRDAMRLWLLRSVLRKFPRPRSP